MIACFAGKRKRETVRAEIRASGTAPENAEREIIHMLPLPHEMRRFMIVQKTIDAITTRFHCTFSHLLASTRNNNNTGRKTGTEMAIIVEKNCINTKKAVHKSLRNH
jgi:hypothetical protein